MIKVVTTGIILSMVLITLMLYFGEDLDSFLRSKYSLIAAGNIYALITMGTLGLLTLIYWWINK